MDGRTIAPSGTLRAAINLGNPVLAGRDPLKGEPAGITVDIARELARRLGLPLRLVPYEQAGRVTDAVARDEWDVAFLAIDATRAEQISYTAPYVLIEGAYAVPDASDLKTVADVDRAGVRVAAVAKSAYDLHLSRTLQHATLVRVPTAPEAFEIFIAQRLDVVAGVRQPLKAWVAAHPDMRLISERFMAIEQAVCVPKSRTAAIGGLRAFVEELKASGFVADALERHNQPDALVAPPAGH